MININPVIRELQKVRVLDKRIDIIDREIKRLEVAAVSITPGYGGDVISGSHSHDKLEGMVARIADLKTAKQEIEEQLRLYLNYLLRIPEVVDEPGEAEEQMEVLYGRYFERKTFLQIAREIRCSERKVCYVHGRALQSYEMLMNGGVGNEDP